MNKYLDTSKWTYGAEHELADWDIHSKLPDSVKRNLDDYSIVNSNGIANDPSGKITSLGGELNTIPTTTIEDQVKIIDDIRTSLPNAKTNYHSNLHLHISIPDIKTDLDTLKYIQKRIHQDMPSLLEIIDPLVCKREDYSSDDDYKLARKRINHSKVSRHKLLTSARLSRQLSMTTVEDFFNAEPPSSKSGKPLFHLAPRLCINLRSLLDNNTIEFRHWAGTLDTVKFKNAFYWCKKYLYLVISKTPISNDFIEYSKSLDLPRQELVDPFLERSFNLTSAHKVGREEAEANAKAMRYNE